MEQTYVHGITNHAMMGNEIGQVFSEAKYTLNSLISQIVKALGATDFHRINYKKTPKVCRQIDYREFKEISNLAS